VKSPFGPLDDGWRLYMFMYNLSARLRATVHAAVAECELERNPVTKVEPFDTSEHPAHTREDPNSLTPEEFGAFVTKLREFFPQHHAMALLGFVTGLRPSSLRPLRRHGEHADVLWDEGAPGIRSATGESRDDGVSCAGAGLYCEGATTMSKKNLRVTSLAWLLVLLATACAASPLQIEAGRAGLHLRRVEVMDDDPMVRSGCEGVVAAGLRHRGFALEPDGVPIDVEVSCWNPPAVSPSHFATADAIMIASIGHDSGPSEVFVSGSANDASGPGELSSPAGRSCYAACQAGAERLASALAEESAFAQRRGPTSARTW
jgi:hypothetical protein